MAAECVVPILIDELFRCVRLHAPRQRRGGAGRATPSASHSTIIFQVSLALLVLVRIHDGRRTDAGRLDHGQRLTYTGPE